MSYLKLHHLCEYYGNTVVWYTPYNTPAYISSVDCDEGYDEDNDADYRRWVIHGRYTSGNRFVPFSYDIVDEEYDDIVPSIIRPYLPRTQYILYNDEGVERPAMLKLVRPEHYKRSMDGERYHIVSLDGMHEWSPCMPWNHGSAKDMAFSGAMAHLEEFNSCVLSPDLALKRDNDSVKLLYLDHVVGVLNDNYGARVHPKYKQHFSGLIEQAGLFLC